MHILHFFKVWVLWYRWQQDCDGHRFSSSAGVRKKSAIFQTNGTQRCLIPIFTKDREHSLLKIEPFLRIACYLTLLLHSEKKKSLQSNVFTFNLKRGELQIASLKNKSLIWVLAETPPLIMPSLSQFIFFLFLRRRCIEVFCYEK